MIPAPPARLHEAGLGDKIPTKKQISLGDTLLDEHQTPFRYRRGLVGEKWPTFVSARCSGKRLRPSEGLFPVRRHGPSAISLGFAEESELRTFVQQASIITANAVQEPMTCREGLTFKVKQKMGR